MVSAMKYLRHYPLAFWALVCLVLGGLAAFAQLSGAPDAPTRAVLTAPPAQERSNVMALLGHLATVHAAAAPPASGLAQWGLDTAAMAQTLADRRAAGGDDRIVRAYRDVAAAAAGLATVDPANREQILTGIAALGAAGNRLGAAVNDVELPGATDPSIGTSAGPGVETVSWTTTVPPAGTAPVDQTPSVLTQIEGEEV